MIETAPIREIQMAGGRVLRYVLRSDIPPEILKQFERDVVPCACPHITGEPNFYAHDWERWLMSHLA